MCGGRRSGTATRLPLMYVRTERGGDPVASAEPMMRAMNSVLRRLLGTLLGRPLTDFMVLNFAGRKSGRRFSIPVSAHVVDGTLYALANAGWKVNFRGGAPRRWSAAERRPPCLAS